MRPAPIAQVIIHSRPTLSLLLQGVAEPCHITIVVITPCEHYIVGHNKTIFHHLQHFFIGHKLLRYLFHPLVDMLAEHQPLVVYHLLQCRCLVIKILAYSLHSSIVNTTHTDSIYILILSCLFKTISPILLHSILVGEIVISTTFLHIPFPGVVAHHRFAM